MREHQSESSVDPIEEPSTTAPIKTAVLFFHGMGSQKRYEDVSGFLHYLSRFYAEDRDLEPGRLTVQSVVEAARSELGKPTVSSLELVDRANPAVFEPVRFYDAYYAPVLAAGVGLPQVAWWLFSRVREPLKGLFSPWYSQPRLQRATLFRMLAEQQISPQEFDEILDHQERGFWPSPKQYMVNALSDRFNLRLSNERLKEQGKQLFERSYAGWKSLYRRDELLVLGVVLSFVLGLLGLLGALVWMLGGSWAAVAGGFGLEQISAMLRRIGENWQAGLLMLAGLGLAGVAAAFLRDYMGDVYQWVSYEEMSAKYERRKAVMKLCENTLEHVLRGRYERVIIVAHSLGSSVAYETLISLTKRVSSAQQPGGSALPLHKVKFLFTVGSPIDKIHYFFNHYQSNVPEYRQIVESLRGDLGQPPFTDAEGQPCIRWVNIWDRADIISGALYSPRSAEPGKRCLEISNLEVESFRVPDPGSSHTAYFAHREANWAFARAILDDQTTTPHDLVTYRKGRGGGVLNSDIRRFWMGFSHFTMMMAGWLAPFALLAFTLQTEVLGIISASPREQFWFYQLVLWFGALVIPLVGSFLVLRRLWLQRVVDGRNRGSIYQGRLWTVAVLSVCAGVVWFFTIRSNQPGLLLWCTAVLLWFGVFAGPLAILLLLKALWQRLWTILAWGIAAVGAILGVVLFWPWPNYPDQIKGLVGMLVILLSLGAVYKLLAGHPRINLWFGHQHTLKDNAKPLKDKK